jgi:undecaprenyl-diphosphatase
MSDIIAQRVIRIDLFLFNLIVRWHINEAIRRFFYFVSRSADGHVYVIYGIVLLVSGPLSRMIMLALLTAFAANLAIYYLMKNAIKRKRPFNAIKGLHHLIAPPDQYSFPSGHTAGAFIFAKFVGFQFPELSGIILFWAILVGLSRIILRVHYPTDVLAGTVLGLGTSHFGLTLLFQGQV